MFCILVVHSGVNLKLSTTHNTQILIENNEHSSKLVTTVGSATNLTAVYIPILGTDVIVTIAKRPVVCVAWKLWYSQKSGLHTAHAQK